MFKEIKHNVENAIKALKQGIPIVVLDDHDRENEGDLVAIAETITPETVNFMITHGKGLVCTPLTQARCEELGLTPMVSKNTESMQTAFTVSIDLKGNGVTTGISTSDRAKTIKALTDAQIKASDLARPGHIFPLVAKDGGVLKRVGHTEACVDLARLSGFTPAGAICEIINDDGTMTRGKDLENFVKKYDLPMLTIADLYQYRLATEIFVTKMASSTIPFKKIGKLEMSVYKDNFSEDEVIVLSKPYSGDNPLVRMHSSCVTGDIFGSLRCDCQAQLHKGIEMISEEGGIFIYLDQEGRGIGLTNKLKAYNLQINQNMDTVEANIALGLPIDARKYDLAIQVLKYNKVNKCRLISNNPKKLEALRNVDISAEPVYCEAFVNSHNRDYLITKQTKTKHTIKGL
ncbi:3,4-dihydroxy-2-butanone-4-phosphate synthase [Francisella halioticida]|uniref:3,4-dihydroxy-2-butanone 4-phosphate synthase n=1 Tax=Francisella halioticida TaxID=549298 RepID=A0ABM6LXP2_9GAMM|nr:3,4-dihydroxy-2-butanone-4-phosphate synthase [Francisella halioticida]ASG67309.1 3,4-dihydroxy-2-butanone-4-phosphate synthase [Francisella halioticida]BCD92470.1 3,4-dihydroxy-2-butanone-4-phosphate synthase [Francisella halioticida]